MKHCYNGTTNLQKMVVVTTGACYSLDRQMGEMTNSNSEATNDLMHESSTITMVIIVVDILVHVFVAKLAVYEYGSPTTVTNTINTTR